MNRFFLIRKIDIYFLGLFLVSLILYLNNFRAPGGDSNYYYIFSEALTKYYEGVQINENIFSLFHNESAYIPTYIFNYEKYGLIHYIFDETFSYVYLSSNINFFLGTNYGIIFFQMLLLFFSYNSFQRILKVYNYKSNKVLDAFILLPLVFYASVPSKEIITLFLITYSFEFYLKGKYLYLLSFLLIFLFYRWNYLCLFIYFIGIYQINYFLLKNNLKKIKNLFFILIIVLLVFVTPFLYKIAGTGYEQFNLKYFISVFFFPLLKEINVIKFDIQEIIYVINWNLYSILWYAFIPILILNFYSKNVNLNAKSMTFTILFLNIFLAIISGGDQAAKFKLPFYLLFYLLFYLSFNTISKSNFFILFYNLLFLNVMNLYLHFLGYL